MTDVIVKSFKRSLFFLLLFPFLSYSESPDKPSVLDANLMLKKFTDTLTSIYSATYKVENTERIGNEFLSGSQYIVYQKLPFQCKIEFIQPNQGSQVVFGHKSNYATYSPIGFPYFDISLDPLGSLMRRNNHHTVYEVGFDYIYRILDQALEDTSLKYEITLMGDTAYYIKAINPNFKFIDYKVKKDETIRSIAHDRTLNEYLILEQNEEFDFYDDISEGDILQIPTSYAKEVHIVINKTGLILKDIYVYDQKGLFEEYHYTDMKINISSLNLELDN